LSQSCECGLVIEDSLVKSKSLRREGGHRVCDFNDLRLACAVTRDGCIQIDLRLGDTGARQSGRDADVEADVRAVVEVAHAAGAIVKVIFENAYLTDDEKVRACHLTEAAGADFVKTSTGFAPGGATHDDLRLMRANTSPHIQVKAAGGVRTLDALLDVMALGVTRIGATATKTIIDDFRARKAGRAPVRTGAAGGGY